jgi:hypothetical protein
MSQLGQPDGVDALLIEYREIRPGFALSAALGDALENYGRTLLDGSAQPDQTVTLRLPALLRSLEAWRLSILAKHLREAMQKQGERFPEAFLDGFGEAIGRAIRDEPQPEDLPRIITPIVRERKVAGARLVASVIEEKAALFHDAAAEDRADLAERLRMEFEGAEQDEFSILTLRIARALGLAPAQK